MNREYKALNAENGRLINEYNSLTAHFNAINNEYSLLLGNYNSLTAEHNNLVNTYNSLLNEYNDTAQSFSEFKQTAIAPPYIYIHGREVHLAFLTPDQTVYTWEVPFGSLEYDLQRGNYERHRATGDLTYPPLSLTNKVNGETYRVIDYRRFVDPSSFTAFSRYFYDRASSDDEFIYEIWYIVAQLTAYSNRVLGTDADGSGLGLPIVQEIALLHSATVELTPGLWGHGTQVIVTFRAQGLRGDAL